MKLRLLLGLYLGFLFYFLVIIISYTISVFILIFFITMYYWRGGNDTIIYLSYNWIRGLNVPLFVIILFFYRRHFISKTTGLFEFIFVFWRREILFLGIIHSFWRNSLSILNRIWIFSWQFIHFRSLKSILHFIFFLSCWRIRQSRHFYLFTCSFITHF
jgi:hypothetical protein